MSYPKLCQKKTRLQSGCMRSNLCRQDAPDNGHAPRHPATSQNCQPGSSTRSSSMPAQLACQVQGRRCPQKNRGRNTHLHSAQLSPIDCNHDGSNMPQQRKLQLKISQQVGQKVDPCMHAHGANQAGILKQLTLKIKVSCMRARKQQ